MPAGAVATVFFEADALEAAFSPRDADFACDDFGSGEVGGGVDEVGGGGRWPFDLEVFADGFGVVGVGF